MLLGLACAWESLLIAYGELGWLSKCTLPCYCCFEAWNELPQAPCWDSGSLPWHRRMIWLCGQKPKITNCALLSVMWGSETLERVSKVSDLWEWLLERWVKAGIGIMLLGLLCSSWEGQRAFPCPGCPQPPHCLPQCFRAGFWEGSGAQHLPKGEIHSFNFLVFIPLLMHPISGLKPVLCFDTGLLQMKMFNLFSFSMQNWRKNRMTHLHSLKSGKGFISRLIWELIPLFSSLPLLLILKQAQEA